MSQPTLQSSPLKVLVLGATSGIAEATCRIWAAQGASLFLVARNAEKLAAVAADLQARGASYVDTRGRRSRRHRPASRTARPRDQLAHRHGRPHISRTACSAIRPRPSTTSTTRSRYSTPTFSRRSRCSPGCRTTASSARPERSRSSPQSLVTGAASRTMCMAHRKPACQPF